MNISKTKKLTIIGILCALAYIAAVFLRVPLILFLRYDPKDVIIAIGGFLLGAPAAFIITIIVSVVQMVTVSGTGILGCMMNIISSCSFACSAALICRRKQKPSGVLLGLLGGLCCQVIVMMFWNYFIAPLYMGYPKEAVTELLFTAFLPFNLIKGGLNAAITLLLYKPAVFALSRSHLIESGYK